MTAQRDDTLYYNWLHDDLEEDFVGADWHQDAIRALSTSLTALAEAHGWPWHVGDQLTLIGEKPDGTDWRPGADVSVYPRLGPDRRQDVDTRIEGPPALAIEVASASTWRYDVSLESTRRGKRQAGKAFGYLFLMRVPEYLVFDPYAEYLGGKVQVRAWRRTGDVVQEWQPHGDGRYHSETLPISFRTDGPLLRVFDPAGNPVPYWFENAREAQRVRALERDVLTRDQEIAALRAELERSRGENQR